MTTNNSDEDNDSPSGRPNHLHHTGRDESLHHEHPPRFRDEFYEINIVEDTQQQHDQLPLVEECKTNQRIQREREAKTNSRFARLKWKRYDCRDPKVVRPDPSCSTPSSTSPELDADLEEEGASVDEDIMIDTLLGPDIKEEIISSRYFQRTWIRLFLVVSAILGVVLGAVFVERSLYTKRSRTEDVIWFLVHHDISSWEMLQNPKSAQHQAAAWIADHDALRLSMRHPLPFVQRYVLAVLYYGLGGDETWPKDLTFLSARHVCEWKSVVESEENLGQHQLLGVHSCEEIQGELVVTGLRLPPHGLRGTLPHEIQVLSHLESLYLQYNEAIGGILEDATGLRKLTNLQHLHLQQCSFAGIIPDWIGELTSLTSLGLGNNRLSGSIPSTIQQLIRLQTLGLDNNMLHANLDIFGALTSLRVLYLNDNMIGGTLSSVLLSDWSKLQELDVSENVISSALPGNLFSHPALQVLDIHSNRLTGQIPEAQQPNDQLKVLALQENELSWMLPRSLSSLESLEYFDISRNDLVGTWPDSMGDKLEYLSIGQNAWNRARMPSFFGRLTRLLELSLKDSQMTGPIPLEIGYLTKLNVLDLSENELTGTFPSAIGFLSQLKRFSVQRNQISGSLPKELMHLTGLDLLRVEGNHFTGSANVICQMEMNITYFASDCEGNEPELECSCCTVCCSDEIEIPLCSDLDEYVGRWNPIGHYHGHERIIHEYGIEAP